MSERHEIERSRPLQLWGGIECTVNRVGDCFFDQIDRSGHARRPSDLDRIAGLGIRVVRYPLLWEQLARSPDVLDWRWADERMQRMRELGIRPIVGFLHHGSGPRWTSLVDPRLPHALAELAGRVAARYPWIDAFTPINEPLTTARFSGLYGHWYPHGRSADVFVRCLFHQCAGIVRSMERIRAIRPSAALVQTEDIGRVRSTPRLSYQADFEDERRWLSFDLLSGRIDGEHPLRAALIAWGASERELDWFLEHACPPDVMGINHYVTSDRYLDEDLSKYAVSAHGGNEREAYADVEAVRAAADCAGDTAAILRETWDRYQRPVAITERQLAGAREEQLRWLHEGWTAAQRLRDEGVDVRAVTAWSLLGAFDWNHLVTVDAGCYESGAFDLRAPSPRPTAVARMIRQLATDTPLDEPIARAPGWWRRPDRFFRGCGPVSGCDGEPERTGQGGLLVFGARGTLGAAFARICRGRGIECHVLHRDDADVTDASAVERVIDRLEPWGIVNATGYVRVDDAEHERALCFEANAHAPSILAAACARHGVRLLTFSTDLVFDGGKLAPYVESDELAPLSVYGCSKVDGERRVLELDPTALVIRSAAFFGPWDSANFVTRALSALEDGGSWVSAEDVVVSPTYVVDLVNASLDLLIDRERGVWHLANQGAVSWAELARRAATMAGLDPGGVDARPAASLGWVATRPPYSALASERGWVMPTLEDALSRFIGDRAPPDAPRARA